MALGYLELNFLFHQINLAVEYIILKHFEILITQYNVALSLKIISFKETYIKNWGLVTGSCAGNLIETFSGTSYDRQHVNSLNRKCVQQVSIIISPWYFQKYQSQLLLNSVIKFFQNLVLIKLHKWYYYCYQ